ncbi:MAG: hypothetical protein IKE24_04755 [Clostridia bacterium]|nr:hypothetical protein [Clostridia bacterium]
MSADLFEVLSLAARYLFTLLGVLIVLRAFGWLLADRAEKHRRLRNLPDAGTVGEFVLLSEAGDLPEGTVIPVPWEGVLGSVRSCDVTLAAPGIRRQHLFFSFQPGQGLILRPFSGCDAFVNDTRLTCRSRDGDAPMTHGSFLRVGSALLRLRLLSGMDPRAEFGGTDSPAADPVPGNPEPAACPAAGGPFPPPPFDQAAPLPPFPVREAPPMTQPAFNPQADPSAQADPSGAPARGPRRSDRWEADWSE